MKSIFFLIIAIALYYWICNSWYCSGNFNKGYGRFLVKTWLYPIMLPFLGCYIIALFFGVHFSLVYSISNALRFPFTNSIPSFFTIVTLFSLVINMLFYFVIKGLKFDKEQMKADEKAADDEFEKELLRREPDITKRFQIREQRAREKEERAKAIERANREAKEAKALENDDMRAIKKILASIPQKIDALNLFTKELQEKINRLQDIANNAVENAYGDYSNGNNYYYNYDWLRNNFSSRIDPIIVAQCDRIIKNVLDNIAQKEQSIRNNAEDVQKYNILTQNLNKEYAREFRIEKMKKISAQLSQEISTTEQEIADSAYNVFSLEKAIAEVNQLTIQMEERRNLEIQFGQIDI